VDDLDDLPRLRLDNDDLVPDTDDFIALPSWHDPQDFRRDVNEGDGLRDRSADRNIEVDGIY
jgi:hypothetical protein